MKHWFKTSIYGNAIITLFLAAYLFFAPAVAVIGVLADPDFKSGEVPEAYFRWHADLTERYEPWARERVAAGRAKTDPYDISGTEWPLFSSVFYLWATENMQQAWEQDPSLAPQMPSQYARGAIEAAAALVADPGQAAWVKKYWGEDYLHRENLFYRMLLISGLTSYQNLLGDDGYQWLLSSQVETLAAELDASPYGLLNDYPDQCYIPDILAGIAAIQRSDRVLGTDHSSFLARALRGFEDSRLDPNTGLPAYRCDPQTGRGFGGARGVGNAYMLTWAPDLWPGTAVKWYQNNEEYYWQENWFIVGWREFSLASDAPEWFFLDVDAGPVMAGYGTAASAFGIGAARANGRFDHAVPLAAEALVASWPLPDGSRLLPDLLSNLSDAPFTGEAALLFSLTRHPVVESVVPASGGLPFIVYLSLFLYVAVGLYMMFRRVLWVRRWRAAEETIYLPAYRLHLAAWSGLVLIGIGALVSGSTLFGLAALLLAQLLPRRNFPAAKG